MLGIPTIDLASGHAPSARAVRGARLRLLAGIAGSFAVVAWLIARVLVALGESHMQGHAANLDATGAADIVGGLLHMALFAAAAYALYACLTRYLDLCSCDESVACRVLYAVCLHDPRADRYRRDVLRQGRGFLTAEIDAFYALCPADSWGTRWPEDLSRRVRSSAPLAGAD